MLSRHRTRARKVLVAWSDRLRGRTPVHFLHIGKTGGTAIKESLEGAVTADYRVVLHPHNVVLRDIPRGEKVFFFVRDPLARFVSGFYSRQRRGRPRYDIPWQPEEEEAFSTFSTPDDLARSLASADAARASAAVRAMRTIRHVRYSYWDWFGDEDQLRARMDDVLFVGALEHLADDFQTLQSVLGLGEAALPTDPVRSHRSPSGLDRRLSDASVAALRRWYHRDYQFLDLVADHFGNVPRYIS